MNIFDYKENVNISSAQFALSNFPNIDSGESCKSLNEILINFKNKRNAWMESECLFNTNDEMQIFYGLIILIDLIKYKWNCISAEQQECISSFILGKVLKLSTNPSLIPQEELILRKFNHCLLEIFFVKWSNDEWPVFIDELIDSCNGNEFLCQNNILVFKNLYELVFQNDLSVNLSKEKLEKLKFYLTSLFDKILKLILSIIDISRNVTLVLRSLDLLELFISIKPDIIKDYDKIFMHLSNLLLVSVIRKDAIKTIIAFCRQIKPSNKVVDYLKVVSEQLTKIIPSSIVLQDIFSDCKCDDKTFLILIADLLAEFIVKFYKEDSCRNHLEDAWLFLLRLTAIENDDISTICFDYWSQLSDIVYKGKSLNPEDNFYSKAAVYLNEVSDIIVSSNCSASLNALQMQSTVICEISIVYFELRLQSIQNIYQNMFKLNPNICIEQIKNRFNNLLISPQVSIKELYSVSRSIDFVLNDSEIQAKLKANSDQDLVNLLIDLMRFSFNSLMTLQAQMLTFKDQIPISCSLVYLIGSYSVLGNFHLELSRCMLKRLYQYLTIGNDLMKNMALDSFKKWSISNCFYFISNSEKGVTILSYLLNNIGSRSVNLNQAQIVAFHESICMIISKIDDPNSQEMYTKQFFKLPNDAWKKILNRITEDVTSLLDTRVLSSLRMILDINIRCCTCLKTAYINQLLEINEQLYDLLNLIFLSLHRISSKCCRGEIELQKPPLSHLISLYDISLSLIQTYLYNISWTNEVYLEISKLLIPLLMSAYCKFSGTLSCCTILITLNMVFEAGEVAYALASSVLTRVIPPSQLFIDAAAFEDINDSSHILILLKSIMRNYVSIITNSTLVPFIELIHVIDFVLWGLKAVLNETRQTCYSIIELILQYFESDRVNSHQRKKFIRQFYMHIIQTVLISSLDGVRVLEDDIFVSVVRILSNWVSSSFISFRLNKSDRKKSKQNNLQQIIDANKEHVTKHLLILLTSIYPNIQEAQHIGFISGILRASNSLSINEIVREYRMQANQFAIDKAIEYIDCP